MITDRMVEAALNKMLDKLYELGGVRVAGWPAMQKDAMRTALAAADAAAWEGIESAPSSGDVFVFNPVHDELKVQGAEGEWWRSEFATKACKQFKWRPLPAPPVQS